MGAGLRRVGDDWEMPHRSLTPRMAKLLANIERAGQPPYHSMPAAQARAAYERAAEVLEPPRAPLARVEDVRIPVGGGTSLPARLYASSTQRLPAMLFLHGGGFTIGSLETHDSLCRQLALRSGALIIALDYRLAPEHRFPCAVNDAWDAMHWLAEYGEVLGLYPHKLAVGGDSAGGTLAAVCAIRARDLGIPLCLQVLITPGTAAHADSDSHRRLANGFLLEAEGIAWFFDQYIDLAQRTDWRFAPLLADALEGVAPACVVLAESDPLVDEGLAYADRLRMAGVNVELQLARGVTHDFIKMGRVLPQAGVAQDAIAGALRHAFSTD